MPPMMRQPMSLGAQQALMSGQMLRPGHHLGFAHNPGTSVNYRCLWKKASQTQPQFKV